MRKFKHKPTGKIFEEKKGYYVTVGGLSAPDWAIEATGSQDWEEIKEPVVPPGIVAFNWDDSGNYETFKGPSLIESYHDFVTRHLKMGNPIRTIKVNDIEWSVGENVNSRYFTGEKEIRSFEWRKCLNIGAMAWYAWFENEAVSLSYLEKQPTRKSIEERLTIIEKHLGYK